jgi:GNAT superfamily N-acetyltransferase
MSATGAEAAAAGAHPLPVEERLAAHLSAWLGAWPPVRPLQLVGSVARELPGWDGTVQPVVGVSDGTALVLSVPRAVAHRLRATDPGDDCPTLMLAEALGHTPEQAGRAGWERIVFRWSTAPAPLPDIGTWRSPDHPGLPSWLRPFHGEVLVALDPDGRVAAGAGRKRHTRHGHEIAVGTEPGHRGQGLARALVAQMARRILVDGGLPLYLHLPANLASARVADAAGFPDRGWRLLALQL